jgi:iron complex outermembrane receptor protein
MSHLRRAVVSTFALTTPLTAVFAQAVSSSGASAERKEKDENIVVMEKFVAGDSGFDPASAIPKEATGAVFGLAKLPIETPRSISVLSGDMLKVNNIVELQDLQRFIPGSWTAPSFVQGAVNVRGDSADVYYNGMKRLTNSGGFPTIIGATDGVNIVKGPPSAAFGPGQVGGYMDYLPKSARASTGKYLSRNTGSLSFEAGSYDYYVASAELGGPMKLFGRPAGFYLYARAEDSKSYYIGKFQKDQIVQGTLSTDLAADGGLRAQFGFNFQNDRGTGVSGWNRVTQELIDHGTYETGTPLFNMDQNNDGFISAAEIAANPMVFTIPWATVQAARAGTGSLPPLPRSFALDPATVGTVQLNGRQVLLERFLMAYDYMGFADLVLDRHPRLTFRLKNFTEYQKREKFSDTSTAQNNFSFLAASTGIVEYKPENLPRWLKLQALGALNWRWVDTYSNSNLLHQIYPRIDIWRNPGTRWQPNWIVANYLDHPELMGRQTVIEDNHVEYGAGLILDVTFFERVNVMFNQRKDYLWADVVQTRNNFNAVYDEAIGTDDAASWSLSTSVELFKGFRPYATYADGQTYLPGTGSALSGPGVVRFGALQTPSTLKEAGLKMSLFKDRLFVTLAG